MIAPREQFGVGAIAKAGGGFTIGELFAAGPLERPKNPSRGQLHWRTAASASRTRFKAVSFGRPVRAGSTATRNARAFSPML